MSGFPMRYTMRYGALVLGVAVVLAACATGDAGEATTTTDGATTTAATQSTEAPAAQPSVTEPDTTAATPAPDTNPPPQVEGPPAPDFTFALADGSSFTLSDEQKPVYLVFWAEW